MSHRMSIWVAVLAACGALGGGAARAEDERLTLPNDDTVMRALVAELGRSMDHLVLKGLEQPYFIQYVVEDVLAYTLGANLGGIVADDRDRSRSLGTRIRVGSTDLDNTNVGFPVFPAALPIDDDEVALRQAIWLATDAQYKIAVQILARKRAFLKERKIKDRPPDFSAAPVVHELEPPVSLAFDRAEWTDRVRRLSARFGTFPEVEDSGVRFFVAVSTETLVNSEGTRIRHGDSGILVTVRARVRADDGMRLSDRRVYMGERFEQLPSMDQMLSDIDTMCANLRDAARAPMIEHYSGPVLFDAPAAGDVFGALLARDVVAKPVALGGMGGDDSMEKKIGLRILPRGFQVYDDPTRRLFGDQLVGAWYRYDDEGVQARRVNVVEDGMLKTLLSSRAPSRKIRESNGHGRGQLGDATPRAACLYVRTDQPRTPEQLKEQLIQAARDEGLEFGLRVRALNAGMQGLGRPRYASKVYVADGREEPVRGLEFQSVSTRELKDILAAGDDARVDNIIGGVLTSIITPSVLFEDLELTKVDEQFDSLPILKPPARRTSKDAPPAAPAPAAPSR